MAILVPKLVAMATSLRPSISAMVLLDSLTPKTLKSNSSRYLPYSRSYIHSKFTCPTPTPSGEPISKVGIGGPPSVFGIYGRPHLATD